MDFLNDAFKNINLIDKSKNGYHLYQLLFFKKYRAIIN